MYRKRVPVVLMEANMVLQKSPLLDQRNQCDWQTMGMLVNKGKYVLQVCSGQ